MKRRAREALVFLLLGTAINIAIAWTAVVIGPGALRDLPQRGRPMPVVPVEPGGWPLTPPPEWSPAILAASAGWAFRQSDMMTSIDASGWIHFQSVHGTMLGRGRQYLLTAGWPWRSLQRTLVRFESLPADTMNLSTMEPESLGEGLHVPLLDGRHGRAFLPLIPCWAGFAANSTLFACGLWFLVWSIGRNAVWTRARAVGVLAVGLGAAIVVSTAGVIWFPARDEPYRESFSTHPRARTSGDLLDLLPPSWKPPVRQVKGTHQLAESAVCSLRWAEAGSIELHRGFEPELVTVSSGWPLRCFVATGEGTLWKLGGARLRQSLLTYAAQYGTPSPIPDNQWRYGLAIPDFLHPSDADPLDLGPSSRVIPLRPIAFGLIVDTLFFASVVGALVGTVRGVRRGLRLRRSLCAECAYPVGTSPVCTECGRPVTPRRAGVAG